MKTLTLTGIIFLFCATLNAQVTLNHTYNYSTSAIKLETQGYKYYLMDVPAGQCRIYNTDHSLFKSINCNVPNGFFLSDIKFLSESIFDTDPGIELLCTFYKYNSSKASYEYDSKIINEDGSQMTFIDGAIYNYINKTDENTYKLFSYCYDYSVSPEKVWTQIFNLPGKPVSSVLLNENKPEVWLNAFPNPATQSLKVAYSLPQSINQGTLHLVDNTGRFVDQFIVDKHSDFLMLDVSRFQSGIYHYFIEYGQTKTPAKQLVIN